MILLVNKVFQGLESFTNLESKIDTFKDRGKVSSKVALFIKSGNIKEAFKVID